MNVCLLLTTACALIAITTVKGQLAGCTEEKLENFHMCMYNYMGEDMANMMSGVTGEDGANGEMMAEKMTMMMEKMNEKKMKSCEMFQGCFEDAGCSESEMSCEEKMSMGMSEEEMYEMYDCHSQKVEGWMDGAMGNFDGCMEDIYGDNWDNIKGMMMSMKSEMMGSRKKRSAALERLMNLPAGANFLVRMTDMKKKLKSKKADMMMMEQYVSKHCTDEQAMDAKYCIKEKQAEMRELMEDYMMDNKEGMDMMAMGYMKPNRRMLEYLSYACKAKKYCAMEHLGDECMESMYELKGNGCTCFHEVKPNPMEIGADIKQCFEEVTGMDVPPEAGMHVESMMEKMMMLMKHKHCMQDPCKILHYIVMDALKGK